MVKVEMEENSTTGITAFVFTSSDEQGLKTLDKLRVAILGKHESIGNFIKSNELVIKTRIPEKIL
jgi:hypothetical protein